MMPAILVNAKLPAIAGAGMLAVALPAQAQNYHSYRCENGAHFELALFPNINAAYIQLDGKALTLPKFVSVTGTRYRKGGITVWLRGERATLRRAGVRTECRRQ
jgi:membrane-bound inhibitor of C-type lysozyme